MRWFIRALAGFAALWLAYAASPYVALYRLVQAIEARDAEALARRVNFHALRVSLSKQVANAYFDALARKRDINPADRQLAIGGILAIADPVVAQFLSPDGVVALLAAADQGTSAAEAESIPAAQARLGLGELSAAKLWGLFARAQNHGFRNLFVSLPEGRPKDEQLRLQLRVNHLSWRLVGVELPSRMRERLAQDLLQRIAQRREAKGAIR